MNKFNVVEESVQIVENHLVNYLVDTMVKQSSGAHARYLQSINEEKTDLACEITLTKVVEEVVQDIIFNSNEVKAWIDRFVPPPKETSRFATHIFLLMSLHY